MPLKIISADRPIDARTVSLEFRIRLCTDATARDDLDPRITGAVDEIAPASLPQGFFDALPDGTDSALLVFAGETLRTGTPERLRYQIRMQERVWFPLHLPGIPDADLISLEPRSRSRARGESVCQALRLTGTASLARANWIEAMLPELSDRSWAELSLILLRAESDPRSAITALGMIIRQERIQNPVLLALAWRNLAILLARLGQEATAIELLVAAAAQFPGCAEFPWLTAILHFRMGNLAAAVRPLEHASNLPDSDFIGSGGENQWRPRWLMGRIKELLGSPGDAVEHYYAGLLCRPAFRPSVEALLQMRFGDDRVMPLVPALRRLTVREAEYLPAVLNFFEANRAQTALEEFRHLFPTSFSGSEGGHSTPAKQSRAGAAALPVVLLHGPLLVHSSIAGINRKIAGKLLRAGDFTTVLQARGYATLAPDSLPEGAWLRQGLETAMQQPDLTIRHFWPFDFSRPATGRLALITPWEYGAIPRQWVGPIRRHVNEQWVPSEFVRQTFVQGGIAPDRIQVIPNGIDTEYFHPDGPAWRPPQCRSFLFLFVGGAILRKGIDLIVRAFEQAFTAKDDGHPPDSRTLAPAATTGRLRCCHRSSSIFRIGEGRISGS